MKRYPIVKADKEFARSLGEYFFAALEEAGGTPSKMLGVAVGKALAQACNRHAITWVDEKEDFNEG